LRVNQKLSGISRRLHEGAAAFRPRSAWADFVVAIDAHPKRRDLARLIEDDERTTQPVNVNGDGRQVVPRVGTADLARDRRSAHDATRVREQQTKQIELARREPGALSPAQITKVFGSSVILPTCKVAAGLASAADGGWWTNE